jgi:DNA-binding CsgD family transcriptional regulator
MDKYQKWYDEGNWTEIQRVRDVGYWHSKSSSEERDHEFYDWSQTIEENFKRKEVIPGDEDTEIDWEEIMSLQKRINVSSTQMEEKMYQARLDQCNKQLRSITKKTLTINQSEIWELHLQGLGPVEIARRRGVSQPTISEQLESIKIKLQTQVRNLPQ